MIIEKIYSLFKKNNKVCTDSRAIEKDSLFFALKGENFNGNKFAENAIKDGAIAAIIDEEEFKADERYILVEDVLTALQKLAIMYRDDLNIPFIGITGTNGKTTTKELIKSVLQQKFNVFATMGNLNNHIGVPLSVLSVEKNHEIAVIEMGANHLNEIEALCRIAQPDLGIITNIGKAHLEGFGSYEGVITAKSELYQYIKANNKSIFINKDDSLLEDISKGIKKYTYGIAENADCCGKICGFFPYVSLKWNTISDSKKSYTLNSKLIGKYNFYNIMTAICIGYYFSISPDKINIAIENYVPQNNRSQLIQTKNNKIILDAYNANPDSMTAALENFAEMPSENKIVICGDMLELGNFTEKEHSEIIDVLTNCNFQSVFLVGEFFSSINNENYKSYKNVNELSDFLRKNPINNAIILIKGSRGIKLEGVVDVL